MTQKEFNKYHKDITDKEGNPIKVGDIVAFCDSCYADCHLGIVHHFAEKTIVIKSIEGQWKMKYQRYCSKIIKVYDGCDMIPKYYDLLDNYGKKLYNQLHNIDNG